LLFSDGISTLSDADFLKNAKASRPIHCVVSSAKSDYSVMKLIAGKTRGKFVNVNALSSEKLKDELLNETLQFLGAEHGDSVREVYPSIATPVQGNFSVAGISDINDAELTLLFGFGSKVEKRIKVKLEAKNAADQGNAYKIWAQKKIAELDLNYEKNRAELTELGQQFGIVTRNTSLIVLETVSDYILYNIEPPAELQAEYQRRLKWREEDQHNMERDMLKEAVAAAENIKKWWNTDFTPKQPKYPTPDILSRDSDKPSFARNLDRIPKNADGLRLRSSEGTPSPSSGGLNEGYAEGGSGGIGDMLGALMGGSGGSTSGSDGGNSGRRLSGSGGKPRGIGRPYEEIEKEERISQPTIIIKPIKKDNDYLNKLTGKLSDDYQIYFKLRDDYANSPTFYFDMANWFYTHNDRETALRILTSIADLELENPSLYRLLGYRFKEYGEYALEKFVCQKVIQWRPMEPQSYRDYALALADNGEEQAALDALYSLLTKSYPDKICNRSRGIAEVVVTEMNRLIAKNPSLNTSKIDKRLLIDIPVDIRVVINWNMDNTDIDLHVKDPNNEECYYSNRETSIGGHMSNDNASGYGPEQYLLKKAVKGKYRIYINYFSDRQFTSAGPSTIMAEIFTKFADKTEQRRVVSLQMSNATKKDKGKVEIAEFQYFPLEKSLAPPE
jgi:hypothetical protein